MVLRCRQSLHITISHRAASVIVTAYLSWYSGIKSIIIIWRGLLIADGCSFSGTRRSSPRLTTFPLSHHLCSRYPGQPHVRSSVFNGAGIWSFIRVTRIWTSSILNGIMQSTSWWRPLLLLLTRVVNSIHILIGSPRWLWRNLLGRVSRWIRLWWLQLLSCTSSSWWKGTAHHFLFMRQITTLRRWLLHIFLLFF